MPADQKDQGAPKVTKLAGRRVRTQPLKGQVSEPVDEPLAVESGADVGANDERLRADKPPHY
jgi:hypothetical protein